MKSLTGKLIYAASHNGHDDSAIYLILPETKNIAANLRNYNSKLPKSWCFVYGTGDWAWGNKKQAFYTFYYKSGIFVV
jgi:hypothetical protein